MMLFQQRASGIMDKDDIICIGHQGLQAIEHRIGTLSAARHDPDAPAISSLGMFHVIRRNNDNNLYGAGGLKGANRPVKNKFAAEWHPLLLAAGAAAGPTGDDNSVKYHVVCLAR